MPAHALPWLTPGSPPHAFPDVREALTVPNGLLAAGGDLAPERLLYAYRHGIFPWYHDRQPILWWSPDPRAVLFPQNLHISRSLRKRLRQRRFQAGFDSAFAAVVAACAAPRKPPPEDGSWITPAMQSAYAELYRLGHAHSIEIRLDGELAGGLYGVALGGVFFGESMFSRRPDASKMALACLARQLQAWDFGFIDCQVQSAHLMRLGSAAIPRHEFLARLEQFARLPGRPGPWQLDVSLEF
ncbi:MAG: leucyl/phenylalanyl-tRNA--protein transferase [Gammaproteobacteria bacterium]|nr:leucyl/phenylalanyl-tRNA--protein transferase [Gammaproteobacteria bacterium]